MILGLRLPLYLLSQCIYVLHCDDYRTEIGFVLAFTVFICVSL